MIGRQRRFLLEHVDAGTGQFSVAKGICQRVHIDHIATRRVDEYGSGFAHGQVFARNQVMGFGGERHVQRDDVAGAHQLVQGQVRHAHVEHLLPLAPAPRHDLAAEALEQLRGTCADSTRAHNAHTLAPELAPEEVVARAALACICIQSRDVTIHIYHQTDGQLGHALRGITGGVHHLDTVCFTICKVNVVQTRESHVQQLQLRTLRQDIGPDFDVGNDDHFRVFHSLHQNGSILFPVSITLKFKIVFCQLLGDFLRFGFANANRFYCCYFHSCVIFFIFTRRTAVHLYHHSAACGGTPNVNHQSSLQAKSPTSHHLHRLHLQHLAGGAVVQNGHHRTISRIPIVSGHIYFM